MGVTILGIDLTDNEAGTALTGSEKCFHVPTALCRDRKHDLWYIGEEAYEKALAGKGILTDKLLALTGKGGTATIRGVRYEALDLLCRFLFLLREQCGRTLPEGEISAVVLTLPDYDRELFGKLREGLESYGFSRDRTFCVSRAESFLYYVMSKPRELRTGEVGLFDLSDQSLNFYELTTKRERMKRFVWAEKEKLEEAFTISVLQSASGRLLADRIMTSAAERLLKGKIFSTLLLTGKGFESYDWAREFMRFLSRSGRKIFLDLDIFAVGALVRGQSLLEGQDNSGFVALCSGRSGVNVSLRLEKSGKELSVPLIGLGDPIGGEEISLRLLPDGDEALELHIDSLRNKKRRRLRIPLDFLPKRERKTCFVDFKASFRNERTMRILLRDAGFGELYPATEAGVEQEVSLWE